MIYAQLDNDGVCIGISEVEGEIIDIAYIAIDTYSTDYLRRVYRDGAWSDERVESGPVIETLVAPLPINSNPRILSKFEFRKRFTFPELVALNEAKKVSPLIEVIYDTFQIVDQVGLDEPELLQALDVLIQAGIITADRKREIMA